MNDALAMVGVSGILLLKDVDILLLSNAGVPGRVVSGEGGDGGSGDGCNGDTGGVVCSGLR